MAVGRVNVGGKNVEEIGVLIGNDTSMMLKRGGYSSKVVADNNNAYVSGEGVSGTVALKLYKDSLDIELTGTYNGGLMTDDSDYLYAAYIVNAAEINIRKIRKTTLQYTAASISVCEKCFSAAVDENYVYVGGRPAGKIIKLDKTNLSLVGESVAITNFGDVTGLQTSDGFLYACGYGGLVCKLDPSNLSVVKQYTLSTTPKILEDLTVDADYVYVVGNKVYKFNKADLSFLAESTPVAGGNSPSYAITSDLDYLYVGCGLNLNKVRKIKKENLTIEAESSQFSQNTYADANGWITSIAINEDRVYIYGAQAAGGSTMPPKPVKSYFKNTIYKDKN